jgi:hypothetical protein
VRDNSGVELEWEIGRVGVAGGRQVRRPARQRSGTIVKSSS